MIAGQEQSLRCIPKAWDVTVWRPELYQERMYAGIQCQRIFSRSPIAGTVAFVISSTRKPGLLLLLFFRK